MQPLFRPGPGLEQAGREAYGSFTSPEVLVTVEVFDTATGQTAYTMPFAAVGFNPQPEPPEPIRQP